MFQVGLDRVAELVQLIRRVEHRTGEVALLQSSSVLVWRVFHEFLYDFVQARSLGIEELDDMSIDSGERGIYYLPDASNRFREGILISFSLKIYVELDRRHAADLRSGKNPSGQKGPDQRYSTIRTVPSKIGSLSSTRRQESHRIRALSWFLS